MRKIIVPILTLGIFFLWLEPAWVATATDTATVRASISRTVDIELDTDDNSVATNARTIIFDKLDSDDMSNGNSGYMYAPYRSRTGKNWHVAVILANGSTSLTLKIDGTISGISKDKFKIWCGGFFPPGGSTPISGTVSTDWETMPFTRKVSGPFIGSASFNYQLNIAGVTGGTTHTGSITYTLLQL